MSIWSSTKTCHEVAFNDIQNKQRIFQNPVIDLNMKLLVKIVNDVKQYIVFEKNIYFRCATGFEFTSKIFFTFFYIFYEQEENYFRLERLLLLPSQDFTCSKLMIDIVKRLERDQKCVWSRALNPAYQQTSTIQPDLGILSMASNFEVRYGLPKVLVRLY